VPQWNCACANCEAARAGRIPARTQSSVAVSADGAHWYLINASPDLRSQIEAFLPPGPHEEALRRSPIEAVLLTNADLDHVLGLFLLREGGRLTIHAAAAVRRALLQGLRLDEVLNTFCGVEWHEPTPDFSALPLRDGSASGLSARAILLPGEPPGFARDVEPGNLGHSVAWQIADDATGARALIAPDVAEITDELHAAMENSDAVFLDGTFWSDEELQRVKPLARTAREMGHLPVSESLHAPAWRAVRHKVLIHINNTNPILAPGSSERAQVEAAGMMLGEDGMDFEL
jgi:pyrroloquinoline quinone biosynthesis protein B